MKKLVLLFGLVFAVLSPLYCSTPISSSEKEELTKILTELENLTNEQETIIEASKKRNEELESSLKSQEQKLNELENLSKDKQTIIDEQRKIIDEQKNLLEKPKTSWQTIINYVIAALTTFFGGFFTGVILF
jgi:septal ring factor EnvC (AmiA/AmiB activator)